MFICGGRATPNFLDCCCTFSSLGNSKVSRLLIKFISTRGSVSTVINTCYFISKRTISIVPSSRVMRNSDGVAGRCSNFVTRNRDRIVAIYGSNVIGFAYDRSYGRTSFCVSLATGNPRIMSTIRVRGGRFSERGNTCLIEAIRSNNGPRRTVIRKHRRTYEVLSRLTKGCPRTSVRVPSTDDSV